MIPVSRRAIVRSLRASLVPLACLSALASTAAASSPLVPAAGASPVGVLTLLDYFEQGRERAEAFVTSQSALTGRDVTAVLEASRAACVRLEIRFNERGGAYQARSASGVLVDGGRRVLTAGHALPDDPGQSIRVMLADGRSYAGRRVSGTYEVFTSGDQDWGLIDVLAPPDALLPSLPLARPTDGGLAFVLGYPSDLGLDAGGHVAPGLARLDEPLQPLLFVGRIRRVAPLDLEPVAGCIPLGGASGAPVIDEHGGLLGVFVSVSQEHQGGSTHFSYQAARLDAVERALGAPLASPN
jgi:hypothetical protein